MAIADKKKFQTCANLLYLRVTKPIAEANAVAATIRQAIVDNNLQAFLTPAEQTALQNFVNDLSTLAGSAVVTKMANAYVPSHRSQALAITGVND